MLGLSGQTKENQVIVSIDQERFKPESNLEQKGDQEEDGADIHIRHEEALNRIGPKPMFHHVPP